MSIENEKDFFFSYKSLQKTNTPLFTKTDDQRSPTNIKVPIAEISTIGVGLLWIVFLSISSPSIVNLEPKSKIDYKEKDTRCYKVHQNHHYVNPPRAPNQESNGDGDNKRKRGKSENFRPKMGEFAYTVPFFPKNQTLSVGICQISTAHFLAVCPAIENPDQNKHKRDSKPYTKSNKPIFEKICNQW